jgi:phosphatidylglycerol lysyltransferase
VAASHGDAGEFLDAIEDAALFAFLRRFGRNTNAFLLSYGGYRWFRTTAPPGLIGYVRRGRTIIAVGDPLCAPGDAWAVLAAFRRAVGPRRRIAFVLASAWLVPTLHALGYGTIRVGSDPCFDLAHWVPRGNRAKGVRNPANRARRAGVSIAPYRADRGRDTRQEAALHDCATAWLRARRAMPLRFLIDCQPLRHATARRYFLARHAGQVVGFVACAPIYGRAGWYLEDVIRRPDAPYGVTELLVVSALAALRAEGATMATLGIAPLFEPVPDRCPVARRVTSQLFRLAARPFYNIRGLERYKAKFAPSWWEPVYVASLPPRLTPLMALDILGAFPNGGLLALVGAQVRRAFRRNDGHASRTGAGRSTPRRPGASGVVGAPGPDCLGRTGETAH